MGDVNVNFLKKDDNKECKDILMLFGFNQLIKSATRICDTSQSLIDIIATNNSQPN